MPATRPTICLTERSRSGELSWPRKYFWATMFVAFCDHDAGNSTSVCSKETVPPWPMRASRSSHSTVSNGCTPGCVKKRLSRSASPVEASIVVVTCELFSMPACSYNPAVSRAFPLPPGLCWG